MSARIRSSLTFFTEKMFWRYKLEYKPSKYFQADERRVVAVKPCIYYVLLFKNKFIEFRCVILNFML